MLLLVPNFLLLLSLCLVSGNTIIDSRTPQLKSLPVEDDLVDRQLIPNFNFTTAPTDSRNEARSSPLSESSRAYGSNGVRYLVTSVNQQPPLYIRQPQYQPAPTVTTTTTVSISAPSEPTTTTTTTPTTVAPVPPPPPPVTLGSNCTNNANCAGISNSSRCVAGICVCAAASVPLSNIGCVPLANAFGDNCVITAQCRGLDPLASCYLDRCMCESIYHVAGQSCPVSGLGDYFTPSASGGPRLQCMRKQHLGGACCDSRQCAYEVWNSQCMNSTCVCNPGFVNIGTHACAPKATALGQPCSVNAQCMLPGAFCDTNGVCSCNNQTQFVQGVVMPMPAAGGATDRRKRQIMLSTMCMPTMRLGGMCMSNEQCSLRTQFAICVMGNCTCMNGFLPDYNNLVCQRKNLAFQKPIYEFQVRCCGNLTFPRFVGQVCPDDFITNLGPPFTFTLSDPRFYIDADGGITTFTQLTTNTTITATIRVGTRSSTALVRLIPDPCCLQQPGFSTSAVTINLVTVLPPMLVQPPAPPTPTPVLGCTASNPMVGLTPPFPNTSPFLLNIFDFLNMPCGELVPTNLVSASVSGIGANGMAMTPALCSLVGGGNVAFFTATAPPPATPPPTPLFGVPSGMVGTCVVTATVTACNGLVSTSSLTILLSCMAPGAVG